MLARTFRRLCPLMAALLVALIPARAHAQFGMMGADMLPAEIITKRGVEAYAKILALDKDQRDAAMTLLEGSQGEYNAARQKMADGMKAIQDKIRETQDFSLYRTEMPKLGKQFAEKGRQIEKSFFDDLKASLNDAQQAKWASVERLRRREKGMRFAFVSGSNVDLTQVLAHSRATPTKGADFESILDPYELEIDKAMLQADKLQKEAEDNAGKDPMNFDPSRVEAMLRPFYDNAKLIRDANREYARKLGQAMDDPSRARFDSEIKRRSFPWIYKEAHVQKMLSTAAELTDLDAGQKEQVQSLKSGYEHDVGPMNDRWAKATEEREEKAGGTIMVFMKNAMGQGGEDLNKDVNDARKARKELDEKTKDRLTAVLREDQLKKMPEQPPERNSGNPFADFMTSDEE
jgi:hypothetical protein